MTEIQQRVTNVRVDKAYLEDTFGKTERQGAASTPR